MSGNPSQRIGLRELVRFIIHLVIQVAQGRKWGTFQVVFQNGQIEAMSWNETYKTIEQLPAYDPRQVDRQLAAVASN